MTTSLDEHRLLSATSVAELFDVKRSTIYRWSNAKNRFPQPVKVGAYESTSRWRLRDLLEYQEQLKVKEKGSAVGKLPNPKSKEIPNESPIVGKIAVNQ